jgi:hypothetical protein
VTTWIMTTPEGVVATPYSMAEASAMIGDDHAVAPATGSRLVGIDTGNGVVVFDVAGIVGYSATPYDLGLDALDGLGAGDSGSVTRS